MDKLPIDRPKYLLDLYKWEICLFDDCWNDYYRELKKNGYAAISYAWGKWKDRTEFAHDDPGAAPLYPTFNIGKDPKDTTKNLSWVFPIVRAQPGLPEEQFTIRDVRHTLNTMGLRYVWWDWACIPQGFVDPEKSQEFQIHEALRSVAEQEVNKMRYVYPHSKRGTIWAHNIRWSDDSALKTAISTCCNYYAMGGTTRTLGQVQEIVSALQEANKEEVWLQSLWCFQEGVLYSHPDRQPDVSGGVFRDHDGKTLKVVSPRLEGDLWDLVTVASTIGATIINILRYRAEAPTEDLFRDDPVTDPGIPVFQVWCFNPANEESARLMMDNLVRTGLVFYTSQSPLSLLCGRFNRERSKRTIIADVVVNTVIGALEVNIERYQREAAGKDEEEKLAIEREGMLAELFKIYQWRMLLFATARRQPGPGMHGVWGDLVKVKLIPQQKVPLFTSLENFLSTINLMDRFKPPKPAYEGDAPRPDPPPVVPHDAVQFELPALQYPPHERGVLTLKKLAGFKFFDLSKWNANKVVWKKCMFYDFETTVNKPISIPVFRNVNFEEWEQVFGKLAVLIPLENLRKGLKTGDPWEREDRLRCVVLSHFGNVSELGYPADTGPGLAGLFVGIVDLEGSPGREEGNVELADDVTLY